MNNLAPYSFFFELPLYTKILLDNSNSEDFFDLMNFNGNIPAYNPILKENTTYHISTRDVNRGNVVKSFGSYAGFGRFELVCLRRSSYTITCFFHVEEFYNDEWTVSYFIRKVGQYPSIADIQVSKVKQYDKVLGRPKMKELVKAIRLAASGVGIGSFVYLRRIFEDLIEAAHETATLAEVIDQEQYFKSRTGEKIELLKNHLPSLLVANKSLYGILSLGMHELEEQECLKHFEVVKLGIELILDQKVEQNEKQKKLEETQKKIQEITQELNKK